MTAAMPAVANAVAAAGLILSCVLVLTTRNARIAMQVLLDLLLAASLLRLGATGSWPAIGGAAAVVGIRTTASIGLSRTSALAAPEHRH